MPVVFAPEIAPSSRGTSQTVTPRVLRAEFGDGYSQRGRDGLNARRKTATLSWSSIDIAQAIVIEAFMMERGGSEAFLYALPGETAQVLWTNGPVKRTYDDGEIVSLSVDLTQEFDLA